jgi:sporulation protein YlmC with PRC-barrel domain
MKNTRYYWLSALTLCLLLAGQAFAAPMGPQRSSEIIGMSVQNQQGEKLGKIDELLINRDGVVQYAVLSHGGVLGIGDKLIPIPWKAFKPGKEEKTLLLNMDKKVLEKAPSFDPKKWPDVSSTEWQEKFQYYKDVK